VAVLREMESNLALIFSGLQKKGPIGRLPHDDRENMIADARAQRRSTYFASSLGAFCRVNKKAPKPVFSAG